MLCLNAGIVYCMTDGYDTSCVGFRYKETIN